VISQTYSRPPIGFQTSSPPPSSPRPSGSLTARSLALVLGEAKNDEDNNNNNINPRISRHSRLTSPFCLSGSIVKPRSSPLVCVKGLAGWLARKKSAGRRWNCLALAASNSLAHSGPVGSIGGNLLHTVAAAAPTAATISPPSCSLSLSLSLSPSLLFLSCLSRSQRAHTHTHTQAVSARAAEPAGELTSERASGQTNEGTNEPDEGSNERASHNKVASRPLCARLCVQSAGAAAPTPVQRRRCLGAARPA